MEENKKILKQIKPWLILSAFIVIIYTISVNIMLLWMWFLSLVNILNPLYIAFAFAFVLNIPMKKIENFINKHVKVMQNKPYVRTIAIVLSVISMLVIISVVIVTIVPQLYESISGLISNITLYISNIEQIINKIFQELDIEKVIDFDTIMNMPWNQLLDQAKKVFDSSVISILNNTKVFTIAIGNVFMGFMLSIYLLSSKETFIRQAKMLVKAIFGVNIAPTILNIAKRANDVFENFVGGQLVECVILALIFYTGLTLFNMPYALLIAIVTGISGIIPIFGAMIAMVFGAFLILAVNPIQAIWFIILFQCLQQFENNVVYPRVVGNSVGLQGIWVLLSIIIFGELFGGIGMVLAVPSMAVIYALVGEMVYRTLDKQKASIKKVE